MLINSLSKPLVKSKTSMFIHVNSFFNTCFKIIIFNCFNVITKFLLKRIYMYQFKKHAGKKMAIFMRRKHTEGVSLLKE